MVIWPKKELGARYASFRLIIVLSCWFQRNAFANDIIPVENYIEAILSAHLGTLCCKCLCLKLLMQADHLL